MNKIYMLFQNYYLKLVIVNPDSKLMSIDDKVFHIDEEEISRLLRIIDSLTNDGEKTILDPVRFSITMEKDGRITSFDGNSNTCKEFSKLNNWIGEMKDEYL